LKLIEDSEYAIVYDAGGTMLRVQKAQKLDPPQFTVLGCRWMTSPQRSKTRYARRRINQYGLDLSRRTNGIWTHGRQR